MDSLALDHRSPRSWLWLGLFLLVVIGVGALIGSQTAPDGWYQGLQKPPFNPPNWVFGPVWFTLYVLIAVAGWRTFLRDATGPAMQLWGAQMLLNWAWSPLWFGLHQTWLAFAVILALLASIIAFMAVARQQDQLSAWLFAPYLAWVGFASLLNLSIALLN